MNFDSRADREQDKTRIPEYMEPFDVEAAVGDDHKMSVACSLNHMNQQMMDTIEKLAPVEICRLGGAGNKVNRIALGEVDTYVQPRGGLKFWDLCAPEVIVRAMGGLFTDIDGNRLNYSDVSNPKLPAFIIGKTQNMHT